MFSEYHESGRFVSCHYRYCHTLVYEPELIDDLYCSLTCKKLHTQHIIIEDEPTIDNEENINLPQKSVVIEEHLLSNIENITRKRKQLLTSPCPKKMARRNDNWNENTYIEISTDESESSQQLSDPITISETEEDNDIIDLRVCLNFTLLLKLILTTIYCFSL